MVVHGDNISRNVHWFICLSVKTKASNGYHISPWRCDSTPVPSVTNLPCSTQLWELKEQHGYTQSLTENPSAFPFNSMDKNGTKYGSLMKEQISLREKNKTKLGWRNATEMFHCFRVVQKQTGFKQTLQKDPLTSSRPLWFERGKGTSHFISLPAQWASSLPTSLCPWSWSLAFGPLISSNGFHLGNVIWFTGLFTESPFWITLVYLLSLLTF